MKYSIIKVINGNFSIHGEYDTNLEGAKVAFHNLCAALWNASDVITAMVKICDENLDCVNNYMEYITHEEEVTDEDI